MLVPRLQRRPVFAPQHKYFGKAQLGTTAPGRPKISRPLEAEISFLNPPVTKTGFHWPSSSFVLLFRDASRVDVSCHYVAARIVSEFIVWTPRRSFHRAQPAQRAVPVIPRISTAGDLGEYTAGAWKKGHQKCTSVPDFRPSTCFLQLGRVQWTSPRRFTHSFDSLHLGGNANL